MVVTRIEVLPCEARGLSLLEVEADDGHVGIGVTQAPQPVIRAIVEQAGLRDLVLGEDPRDVRRIWRKMLRDWQAQLGRGEEGGLGVNAMAAIDMALWDLRGKLHGEPLHRLLGGKLRDRVLAYASATAFHVTRLRNGEAHLQPKTAAELSDESAVLVEEGFKAVKFGWGNHFSPADEERLAAVRAAIGGDVRLMLDVGCPAYWSQAWTVKDAMRVLRMLEQYDVYFVEEPLTPRNVEGHGMLRGASSVRIATGESLTTFRDFQPYIDRRAVDIVQPDACQMGITQTLDVARAAEPAGILCVPHSPWSALAVSAHAQILSTIDTGPMVEYPAFASLASEGEETEVVTRMAFADLIEQPLTWDAGYVRLSDKPGLGLGGFVHDAVNRLSAFIRQQQDTTYP